VQHFSWGIHQAPQSRCRGNGRFFALYHPTLFQWAVQVQGDSQVTLARKKGWQGKISTGGPLTAWGNYNNLPKACIQLGTKWTRTFHPVPK
jgi:hypothetical protein